MDWIGSAGWANRGSLGLTWWVAIDGGRVRRVKWLMAHGSRCQKCWWRVGARPLLDLFGFYRFE